MAEQHNFHANEAQYKNRIRGWRLRRNLDKKTVQNMARIQDRRAQNDKKKTAFMFHGIPISERRLRRSRDRLGLFEPVVNDSRLHIPRNIHNMLEVSATPSPITYFTPIIPEDTALDSHTLIEPDLSGANETVTSTDIETPTLGLGCASSSHPVWLVSEIEFNERPICLGGANTLLEETIEIRGWCISTEIAYFLLIFHVPYGFCQRLSHLDAVDFKFDHWRKLPGNEGFEDIRISCLSRKPITKLDNDLKSNGTRFVPSIPKSWDVPMSRLFSYLRRAEMQGISLDGRYENERFNNDQSTLSLTVGGEHLGEMFKGTEPSSSPDTTLYKVPRHLPILPSSESDPFHPGRNLFKYDGRKRSLRGCVWMSSVWGGESVMGSWLKDDVIMSGRSPFGSDCHSICSRDNP